MDEKVPSYRKQKNSSIVNRNEKLQKLFRNSEVSETMNIIVSSDDDKLDILIIGSCRHAL